MNERIVRRDLAQAGAALPVPDPQRLAETAVLRGGTRLRRRHARARSATATTLAIAVAVGAFVAVPGAAPAEAAVECHHDRVEVSGRAAVGHDGVRLTVNNKTPQVAVLVAGGAAAIVPPGRSSIAVPVRPGRVEVWCETGASDVLAASFTVHDPRRVYVDDRVECGGRVLDLRGDGRVESGDPVALTRARLAGLPRGAVVEPAGYVGMTERRVVRIRDGGVVVGVARWHAMPGTNTWALDEVHLCPPLTLR